MKAWVQVYKCDMLYDVLLPSTHLTNSVMNSNTRVQFEENWTALIEAFFAIMV